MVVCLLIGNILLAAIASSNPMYQDAALEKTLKSKYSNYIEETNKDPGVITFNSMLNSGKANGSEFKQMQDTANGAAESLWRRPKIFGKFVCNIQSPRRI